MLAEALALQSTVRAHEASVTRADEWRGGAPARKFLSAPGDQVQDALYHAPWLRAWLAETVGAPVVPTGARGTYNYYARPGDYLALHRDIETCDLTVITCLYDNAADTDWGGTLRLYPHRNNEPLSAIRATPDQGSRLLRLHPGQTLTMLGGIVAHDLLPLAGDQLRIVSILCYIARA